MTSGPSGWSLGHCEPLVLSVAFTCTSLAGISFHAHLLTKVSFITPCFDAVRRPPCLESTFIEIAYLPIWSARLSSLLCQLGVDFPLLPISDWVFCLSMEAGDLRLTPNLWWFPNKSKTHQNLYPQVESWFWWQVLPVSVCMSVHVDTSLSAQEGMLIIEIKS